MRDEISGQDKKGANDSTSNSSRTAQTSSPQQSSTTPRGGNSVQGLTPAPNTNPAARQGSGLGQAQPDPRLLATPPSQPRAGLQPPAQDDPRGRSARNERTGPKPVGFGWKVEERKEQLVVTHVDRGGNADQVGIKVGDQLVELGGIPIHKQDEYREIAAIFGEGDQIVVKLARGGKAFERNLQFGEAPDMEDAQPLPSVLNAGQHPNSLPGSDARRNPSYDSRQSVSDFAPPIVTPAASPTTPSRNQRPSAPPQNLSPTDQELVRLQQIIRQQNETIRQLQTELENIKKRSNSNNSRGLFGR
ncbi:MAG TPA: PDZ domain-containing protein [Pirellulaceae bacterium]|nr:PDZ domain-containing protein [Pirellulaceae bacterium]